MGAADALGIGSRDAADREYGPEYGPPWAKESYQVGQSLQPHPSRLFRSPTDRVCGALLSTLQGARVWLCSTGTMLGSQRSTLPQTQDLRLSGWGTQSGPHIFQGTALTSSLLRSPLRDETLSGCALRTSAAKVTLFLRAITPDNWSIPH